MIAVLAEFVCPSENTVFCKSCFPGFFLCSKEFVLRFSNNLLRAVEMGKI